MTPQKDDATHAEIWDDSTLVDSWNEALQEYERYHSIHARGEKVEDVLNEFEKQSNGLEVEKDDDNEMVIEKDREEEPAADSGSSNNRTDDSTLDTEAEVQEQHTVEEETANTSHSQIPKAPALPPMLVGQVHDEGLKNLLMSWYYAGYYTGLYEGQQQQKQ